jgi:hypothetical protein
MPVRVFLAGAAEMHRGICCEAEFLGLETGVLTSEHKRRREAAIAKRMGDRRQFDGFRPGPDDQPYVGEMQPSP